MLSTGVPMNKIGRNDPCPCGSGRKYKHCCIEKTDWNDVFRKKEDISPHLSIRGRNLRFMDRVAEVLQIDSSINNLLDFKHRFTDKAVREIHEAILKIWPPSSDIVSILKSTSNEVSGLYVGDYNIDYLLRGIVRHSIYANKILVVDPFIYPLSVKDKFNPIIEPSQYRTQTLKNINIWIELLPWIEAGIIEVIRSPGDFDPRLNWESMKRQKQKFDENAELREAMGISVNDMKSRHMDNLLREMILFNTPDSSIERFIQEEGLEKDGYTAKDFTDYLKLLRNNDPNFLEPIGKNNLSGQLHLFSTGGSFDITQLIANITKSYLVTDVYARWKEIEYDRKINNAESKIWSPFAKAFQNAPLKYLNNVNLDHALRLRKENRLASLRGFLNKVWKQARIEDDFDESNAILLSEELGDEIRQAEIEWDKIDDDLKVLVSKEITAGVLAAAPLLAEGHGLFLAAAAAMAGVGTLAKTHYQRIRFPDRFPAAFFMNLK
jgi:hypothetical protein